MTVLEPTRMPIHVRALCWGGPRDGEVMLSPDGIRPFGGRPLMLATCGPASDGAYVLGKASAEEQVIGMQLLQVAGDPRDWPMAWRWHDARQVADLVDQYDTVRLGEKMTRVLALSDWTIADGPSSRLSKNVQDLAQDLGMIVVQNADGSLSFTYPDGSGGLWIP
jgi:hypothetical protein